MVAGELEIWKLHVDARAQPLFDAGGPGLAQPVDRRFDERLDLARLGAELRPVVGDGNHRVHDEVADDDPQARELTDHAHVPGIQADFLVRFAQRAVDRLLAGLESAARKTDLARMVRKIVPPHRQQKRRAVFTGIEQDERGRLPGRRRPVVRPPAFQGRSRRELPLRARAGKRITKARDEMCLKDVKLQSNRILGQSIGSRYIPGQSNHVQGVETVGKSWGRAVVIGSMRPD